MIPPPLGTILVADKLHLSISLQQEVGQAAQALLFYGWDYSNQPTTSCCWQDVRFQEVVG